MPEIRPVQKVQTAKEHISKSKRRRHTLRLHNYSDLKVFLEEKVKITIADTVGQKINYKKSRPKKLVKSNKSISRNFFFHLNPFFAHSKMANNQFLKWEKV